MRCPNCSRDNSSKVIDSRDNGEVRRRRHLCESCTARFTTYEVMASDYEKIQTLTIDASQFDDVIASLRAIKVQFGDRNGSGNGKNRI